MQLDSDVITALFSLLGVMTTAFVGMTITRSNQRISNDQQMRKEFREEINALRADVNTWRDRALRLEDEVREWREKYRELQDENRDLKTKVDAIEARAKGVSV